MDPIKLEYEELTKKIKFYLPMKAYPTKELVLKVKDEHPHLTICSVFYIKDVINTGDLSGILCMIDCKDILDFACSLTHVEIDESEPLRDEIIEYQVKRARRVDIQYKQTGN